MSDTKERPREPACKIQNIKISKYLETRRLTEDVFGECGRKPWRGDTPYAREPLSMSKIKNYRDFWFPYKNCCGGHAKIIVHCRCTKITVVIKYRATITVHYRGGWLPYKAFRGCQLLSTNHCAIPWWLFTAANVTEMKNR